MGELLAVAMATGDSGRRAIGQPSPHSAFIFGRQLGDAVLDEQPLRPAAIDNLPRGDAEFGGESFDSNTFLGHVRFSVSRPQPR